MLSKFRSEYERISISFGQISAKLHLSPDIWTAFGFLSAIIAAILIYRGAFLFGALMVLAMNLCDMMDGATARATGTGTKFGTVLDHVVDRYAEFILIGGLMAGEWVSPVLGLFAASGIVMASYVRAKAESAGGLDHCVVGIAGRQEKLILLYAALFALSFDAIAVARVLVFVMGSISHITAFQRLLYSRSKLLHKQI